MRSVFFTAVAELVKLQLALALSIHINLVPFGDVVLGFTQRTDHCHQLSCSFFSHEGIVTEI